MWQESTLGPNNQYHYDGQQSEETSLGLGGLYRKQKHLHFCCLQYAMTIFFSDTEDAYPESHFGPRKIVVVIQIS